MVTLSPCYKVYIGHVKEDRATIAIPLREMLQGMGITAFVNDSDTPEAMTSAMQTADIGVIVLSPESVPRQKPMHEIMFFLRRREEAKAAGLHVPIVIPVFYRLAIADLYDEPRFDRLDRDGKNLYVNSGFYKRMDEGELEANVYEIRKALQRLGKIKGIGNSTYASNEDLDFMRQKRHILLQTILGTIQDDGIPRTLRNEGNIFRCHYDQVQDTEELILDFHSRDQNGRAKTFEGRLLDELCKDSFEEYRTISIEGMRGVGKTCLLHGLCSLRQVRQRFKGGVYFSNLGKAATQDRLKDLLSTAVEKAGGEGRARQMRSETDWRSVIDLFRKFFEGRQCLFIFDDVWETAEITSDVVRDLVALHQSRNGQQSGEGNKVLLATPRLDVASRAHMKFNVKLLEPSGPEARSMLFKYSGIKPDDVNLEDDHVIKVILGRCAGLPQIISSAGREVKRLSETRQCKVFVAFHLYALMQDMLNAMGPSQEVLKFPGR